MVDRRLGRGLDFFLSGTPKQSPPAAVPQASPKDAIAKELKAAFKLNETQAVKITRRITGRVRLYKRVLDLVPAKS